MVGLVAGCMALGVGCHQGSLEVDYMALVGCMECCPMDQLAGWKGAAALGCMEQLGLDMLVYAAGLDLLGAVALGNSRAAVDMH
jgi:hypothetical protein